MSDRPADGLRHRLAAEYSLPRRRPPRAAGWSIGILVLVTVVGAAAVWARPDVRRRPSSPARVHARSAVVRSTTTRPATVRMWPEPAFTFDQGVLTLGDRRYGIGGGVDRAGLVDLECDGDRTPVVWPTRGGTIAVFGRWAAAGRDERARPIGVLAAGERLELRDVNGDDCPDVVAVTDDSFREVIVSGG